MAIIISKNGKDAERVEKSSFNKEDELQKYIYENPESIPLYDIKEDIRLLILAREFPTNSGPIDAIGIDREGEIYIIETKLYKNPDKRTVLAQALDYGAALWKHSNNFNDFISEIEMNVQKVFKVSLNEKLKEHFGMLDEELDPLLERIKENLDDGVIRFVILMDNLEPRLKDLILYVNQNSQFDVYAVEMEYYKYKEHEIIIPRIYGTEVKKDIAVRSTIGGGRKKWTEQDFFDSIIDHGGEKYQENIKDLYEFSKREADDIRWGTGVSFGSFSVFFNNICSRSIFSVWTNGKLSINFHWMNGNEKIEKFRDELRERLVREFQFDISENYKRSDTIEPEEWVPIVERIKEIIIEQVRK